MPASRRSWTAYGNSKSTGTSTSTSSNDTAIQRSISSSVSSSDARHPKYGSTKDDIVNDYPAPEHRIAQDYVGNEYQETTEQDISGRNLRGHSERSLASHPSLSSSRWEWMSPLPRLNRSSLILPTPSRDRCGWRPTPNGFLSGWQSRFREGLDLNGVPLTVPCCYHPEPSIVSHRLASSPVALRGQESF